MTVSQIAELLFSGPMKCFM